MVEALADKVDAGYVRLFCVDSVDEESWYATWKQPRDRISRHLDYERYLVEEVIPKLPERPDYERVDAFLISARRRALSDTLP